MISTLNNFLAKLRNLLIHILLGIAKGRLYAPRSFATGSLIFLALFVIGTGRLWYLAKDGFSINRIIYPLPKEMPKNPDPGIMALLQEGTYRYLGRGRQCYVFASPDDRYVLKIPRFDRYGLPFFWKALPTMFDARKKSIIEGRRDRLTFTMKSFQIAGHNLQKETAVIYLHFSKTKDLPERFIITDAIHRSYAIDLNRIAFVLQEKKALMMPLCLKAIRENDQKTAHAMLESFLDVAVARAEKNIFNRDPSFLKNFGWDGKSCIQIDIGSFWHKPELPAIDAYRSSLREGTGRLREWLSQIDPETLRWFDERLDERMNSVSAKAPRRG